MFTIFVFGVMAKKMDLVNIMDRWKPIPILLFTHHILFVVQNPFKQ